MKKKEILMAILIAGLTALAMHVARVISMPRGKIMINQDSLDKIGSLTIDQYQFFISQNQRDATFLEELEFYMDTGVIIGHLPSIAINFVLVLLALLVFQFFTSRVTGSNKRL